MSQRYAAMFASVRARGEGAFVPFLVLGDPDPETSLALVRALIRGGADALELGIPFSDPVADGPVIQAAATRALLHGARVADAWAILRAVRAEHPALPMGLLVYANLVLHQPAARFYQAASAAGVDSVLVADLPLLEADHVGPVAREHGIAPVYIAPPNTNDSRLAAIAAASGGYVYVTSRAGVTGMDERLHRQSAHLLERLKVHGAPPALLGFGISRPDQVRDAVGLGAAGAISGSAVVRHVAEHLGDPGAMLAAVEGFVREMKEASKGPGR